jgi:hypothetical protein
LPNFQKKTSNGKVKGQNFQKFATVENVPNRAAEIPSRTKCAKNAAPQKIPGLAAKKGFGREPSRPGAEARPPGRAAGSPRRRAGVAGCGAGNCAKKNWRKKFGAKKLAQKKWRKKTPQMAEFPEKYI